MQAETKQDKPLPVAGATDHAHAFGIKNSFSGRAWIFQESDKATAKELENSGLSAPLAGLLAARGVTTDTLPEFLDPKLKQLLPDPNILANMRLAASRVADAIVRDEKVAVLGDYDVDGACASALLSGFFAHLSRQLVLYIPDRMTEGYGPSSEAMEKLSADGVRLVVTVDCGAAAQEAFVRAKALGLDVVVLDHHAVDSNPSVLAHVNPNGPDDRSGLKQLCAGGVTFLALVAVTRELRLRSWFSENNVSEPDLLAQLDLVGLSTVADVVPITGINRAFVRQGLRVLDTLQRPGIAALAKIANVEKPFGTYHLGFVFGPRINAGGRVGRCDLGARLLASKEMGEADGFAAELDLHNRERQAIEQAILARAEEMALSQMDEAFLLLSGDNWHPGVVGIVASRLKDRFEKPVFVAGFMSRKDRVARGSARSITGIDLGAVVREAREHGLLESGGGHAMAAGFTVERGRLEDFALFLRKAFEQQRELIFSNRELVIEGVLSVSGANIDFLSDLERVGPFGPDNPEPIFALPDLTLGYADIVGKNHVRLRLTGPAGQSVEAISFRSADTPLGQGLLKARGKRVHIAGKLRVDEYKGRKRVQMYLEDAAIANA